MDVFHCNFEESKTTLSEPRNRLAATTLTCPDGKQFALFGGGYYNGDYRNDVDVFGCCDETCDVQFLNTIYLSQPRSDLAAITMNDCCNREVALFGGGEDGNGNYVNNVDIFDCDDILG